MTERYRVDGREVGEEELRRLFATPLPDRMRRTLKLAEGPRLLDVGCYGGEFARGLKELRADIEFVAIDYDRENLRIARALHPDLVGVFRDMSVYELALADASFDCVTFQEVIEHLEGAATAVKELNRVLRVGGSLIVTTPNPYYWRDTKDFLISEAKNLVRPRDRRGLSAAVFEPGTPWNRHIHCWTPSTLLTLLEVNGFEYVWHEFARDAPGRLERMVLGRLPFFGPVTVLKVRKVAEAVPALV